MKRISGWLRLKRMPRSLLIVTAALIGGLLPESTQAAAPKPDAYSSAAASTSTCIEQQDTSRCTDMALRVFLRDTGTEVCLTFFTYVLDASSAPTFEAGCTLTTTDVFTAEPKRLSSGILAPTTVTVTLDECLQTQCSQETSVAATFTAVGKLTTFPAHSRFTDGTCTHMFSSRSVGRDATATITLDGQVLKAPAFLNRSKSETKIHCKTRAAKP